MAISKAYFIPLMKVGQKVLNLYHNFFPIDLLF
jgi:hypothetical protein